MTFANLTIGRKIVLGFTLVFVLLAAVTATAYLALDGAGRNFSRYAASAQETNTAADLESAMLSLKMQVSLFLATRDAAAVAAYDKSKAELDADLTAAARRVVDADRANQLGAAKRLLAQYDGFFRNLVDNDHQLTAVDHDKLAPTSALITADLQKMQTSALELGDMNSAYRISNTLEAFFECTSHVSSFLLTARTDQAIAARAALAATVDQIHRLQRDQLDMEKVDSSLKDPTKTALIQDVERSAAAYGEALESTVAVKVASDQIVANDLTGSPRSSPPRSAPCASRSMTSNSNWRRAWAPSRAAPRTWSSGAPCWAASSAWGSRPLSPAGSPAQSGGSPPSWRRSPRAPTPRRPRFRR